MWIKTINTVIGFGHIREVNLCHDRFCSRLATLLQAWVSIRNCVHKSTGWKWCLFLNYSHCIQQILESVQHCHSIGIVHRDLKVRNNSSWSHSKSWQFKTEVLMAKWQCTCLSLPWLGLFSGPIVVFWLKSYRGHMWDVLYSLGNVYGNLLL